MIIKIEKLIHSGYGLGRSNEKVVFVKSGVPGDVVNVEISEKKKNYDIGNIKDILEPSVHRQVPQCKYFGRCGGCDWQNMDYGFQIKSKQSILVESLEKIAGVKDANIDPIVPSNTEYNYRNRVTIHVETFNGEHGIGFREEQSHKLVPIESCPISSRRISNIIEKVSILLHNNKSASLSFEKIFITDLGNRPALSILPINDDKHPDLINLIDILKDYLKNVDISVANGDELPFKFNVLGLNLLSCPSVFAQSNSYINEKIINTILKWAGLNRNENVLDLYCGFGNLSLHLAGQAKFITGVDYNTKAIKYALINAGLNSLDNCRFVASDVRKYIERYKRRLRTDLVIMDPPRSGAKNIVQAVAKLKPDRIFYLSCNPTTLARDLKQFIKFGYTLFKVCPFDMFPQTYHVETLAILKNN